jgi:hypothetical protein
MDTEMQEIQKDSLKILLKGKWKQKLLFIIWFLVVFFVALIIFPSLLIIDEEGVGIPLGVLFLPFTICWVGLIVAVAFIFYLAVRVRKEIVEDLCKDADHKFVPKVRGRKFSHPKFWPLSHFLSKALFYKCLFVIFSYPGILCKTTIDEDLSYIVTVLICWLPIGLLLCAKQSVEIVKNIRKKSKNSKTFRPVFTRIVEESLTDEIDFTSIQALKDTHKDGNIDPPITDPRRIYYKNTRY